ncbi:MAG: hypothetical protein ACI8W8_002458, partial [Rhodothermales bacterium]
MLSNAERSSLGKPSLEPRDEPFLAMLLLDFYLRCLGAAL